MDLYQLDNEDDDALIEFINKYPDIEQGIIPEDKTPNNNQQITIQPNIQNVQNVQNFTPNVPGIMPKMYFPNSHVVINYNFNSK